MPDNISREGHRQRMKHAYLTNGLDGMADHNVLELILFYAIPRRDVKPVAYNLMNHFHHDLACVFNADMQELCKVDGVGENAAILIKLFSDVKTRLQQDRNRTVVSLHDYNEAKTFASNALSGLVKERVLLITLNNASEIIHCAAVSNGTVNCANVEPMKIVEQITADHAAAVILAHNHPDGSYMPSRDDEKFTRMLSELLHTLGVPLKDHIIVGRNGTFSMANDFKYVNLFA